MKKVTQAAGNCIAGAEEGKIAAEGAYLEPQLFSVERLHWSRLFVATRPETNGAEEKSRYVMFKFDPTGVHEAQEEPDLPPDRHPTG